jgi:hypothetical protein
LVSEAEVALAPLGPDAVVLKAAVHRGAAGVISATEPFIAHLLRAKPAGTMSTFVPTTRARQGV